MAWRGEGRCERARAWGGGDESRRAQGDTCERAAPHGPLAPSRWRGKRKGGSAARPLTTGGPWASRRQRALPGARRPAGGSARPAPGAASLRPGNSPPLPPPPPPPRTPYPSCPSTAPPPSPPPPSPPLAPTFFPPPLLPRALPSPPPRRPRGGPDARQPPRAGRRGSGQTGRRGRGQTGRSSLYPPSPPPSPPPAPRDVAPRLTGRPSRLWPVPWRGGGVGGGARDAMTESADIASGVRRGSGTGGQSDRFYCGCHAALRRRGSLYVARYTCGLRGKSCGEVPEHVVEARLRKL